MRYIFLTIFSLLVMNCWSKEPIKIGVITDIHYLSEQLMTNSTSMLEKYSMTSGKNINDIPAVLDQALDNYLKSDIEILLVSGDITKDGEEQSHIDFVNKLKPLQDKGVKVFVIPGNHDINMPNAVMFKDNHIQPTRNVSPQRFEEIYSNCGFSSAIRRDSTTLSYLTELDDKTWLLAIDAAKYKEYGKNSISSGRIPESTEKWILDILDEAQDKNIQVIGMMHWGLVEHLMYQSTLFKEFLVDDWKRLANLFADKGMKAIFTGHFHANDITSLTSEEGNTIYDIETGTLSSYPFAYRFVELSPYGMKITTKNVVSIPNKPNLGEEDKLRMEKVAHRMATQKLERLMGKMPEPILKRLSDILSQVFILHLYGDEHVDEQLKASLQSLSLLMGSEDSNMNNFELDLPPADNNIEILF